MDLHLFVCIRTSGSGAFLFFFSLYVSFIINGVFTLSTTSGINLGNLYFPIDVSSQLNYTPYFYLKLIWPSVPFLKISVFPVNLFILQLSVILIDVFILSYILLNILKGNLRVLVDKLFI